MEICLIAPQQPKEKTRPGDAVPPLFPPLGLMTVAALTPPEHRVHIIDEGVQELDWEMEPDLIGLTATTAHAPRAYEIADHFRAKGIPVVMGGMHASALPEEALQHVDAVVIGEAEGLWPRVLQDVAQGALQPLYRHETFPEARLIPPARRDLVDLSRYAAGNTLHASRGCPFACAFCAVSTFFGHTYRTRDLDCVLQEAASLPGEPLLFVDDNIIGQPSYARELFARLADLGKSFIAAASTTITRWPELISQAARAGCKALFVGLESVSQQRLADVGKKFNVVAKYRELIQRFHDHGISIIGSFMFGLDGDDPDVFDRTVDFAQENGVDFAQFSIATPLPGTRLYAQLQAEGRVLSRDWSLYDGSHCVFAPRGMKPDQLESGLRRAYRRFYLSGQTLKKLLRSDEGLFGLIRKEYVRRIRHWLRELL